jgi:hypothetical protein
MMELTCRTASLFQVKLLSALPFVSILLFSLPVFSSPDTNNRTVFVHIVHGSKPATSNEYKVTGGYYGGHVVVQLDSFVYGFNFRSRKIHMLPSHRHSSGVFEKENVLEWRTDKKKYKVTTIEIPVTAEQFEKLRAEYEHSVLTSPYDYAFFGMRCAASCYCMLVQADIVKGSANITCILRAFHPKALHKKLTRLAADKHYNVAVQKGSGTRKWEGD